MSYVMRDSRGRIAGVEYPTVGNLYDYTLSASAQSIPARPQIPVINIDQLAKAVWEKVFDVKVIIPCAYCLSHNIITSPTCVQCGGPMGAK